MELSPADRLKAHLMLHHPKIKMSDVRLSETPGFIVSGPGVIDIRGAGYAKEIDGKKVSPLRLWNELHAYFSSHVDVVREKNKQSTIIVWNGMVYTLDQKKSYLKNKEE